MSDASRQIERVLDSAGCPADATAEEPLAPDLKPDRTRQFSNTSFSRMKRSWVGDEAASLGEVHFAADQAVQAQFGRALRVLARLHELTQIPETNDQGDVLTYADGSTRFLLDESGDPVVDYTRLNKKNRTDILMVITTHLYDWEKASTQKWAEAMYAKVIWEQAFSEGYRKLPGTAISGKPTIDDRTQTGHSFSAQDRYFAVFCSALSRQAEALVRNMIRVERLLMNLEKD